MRALAPARAPRKGAGLLLATLAAAGSACHRPATQPLPTRSSAAHPAGQGGDAPGEPWFEEVARARGIDFRYQSGHGDRYLMPEMAGGGAALFDMDGDGDLDLFLVQGGSLAAPPANPPRCKLYRNRGDGSFEDVSAGSGADIPGYGMGVAAGDYDNDGRTDLYVTRFGANVLLHNDGGGHFTDVSAQAGVGHVGWGTSAAFFDMDRDGDLDLYVANYLDWTPQRELACFNEMGTPDYCGPRSYGIPAVDTLYRNDGHGRFTDVTHSSGIDKAFGNGLGVVCGDLDGDGWPDVFVANDGMPNQLWMNRHDGTFVDKALLLGCAVDENGTPKAGMGVSLEDVDGDGDLDLIVGNLQGETDSLYRWDGRFFADVTGPAGLATLGQQFTRFGLGFVDFDDDGCLDLLEANGRVMKHPKVWSQADPYAEPPLLYRGACDGTFREVKPQGGTASLLAGASRGAAFGDVDGDGAIDVVVVNRDGPAWLLHDIAPGRGHWLQVRVLEEHGRDALGATVRMQVGSRLVRRDVKAAWSYASSCDPKVHVGLGTAEKATAVEVTWIDGSREAFGDLTANRVATLRRGAGHPSR